MIYHPAATEELKEAIAWYDTRREGLGDQLLEAVIDAERRVKEAPARWPEIEPGFRKFNLDRFPYRLIYQISRRRN